MDDSPKAAVNNDSPVAKFICGLALGMALTVLYVRYGYSLPTLLQIPKKISSGAIATTASVDLYDPAAPMKQRYRALAVVIAQDSDLFLEVDEATEHQFFEAVLRRKAAREALLLKHRMSAYDAALAKDALKRVLVKKHGTAQSDELKRRMLIADLKKNEFLYGYMRRHLPNSGPGKMVDIVLESTPQNFMR